MYAPAGRLQWAPATSNTLAPFYQQTFTAQRLPTGSISRGFPSEIVCFKSEGHRRCQPTGGLKCQREALGGPHVVLFTCRIQHFCALHGGRNTQQVRRACCAKMSVQGQGDCCFSSPTAVTMPAMTCADVFLNRLNNFTVFFATMIRACTAFNSTEQGYRQLTRRPASSGLAKLGLLILRSVNSDMSV